MYSQAYVKVMHTSSVAHCKLNCYRSRCSEKQVSLPWFIANSQRCGSRTHSISKLSKADLMVCAPLRENVDVVV